MSTYAGYGFNAQEISKTVILAFVEKYDHEMFRKICRESVGREVEKTGGLTEEETETIINSGFDWDLGDESIHGSLAGYICDKINACEWAAGRMKRDPVVAVFDDYIVFENLRFAEDGDERSERIRSADDFISFIQGYFPNEDIVFGNVYEGLEWIDPNFHME